MVGVQPILRAALWFDHRISSTTERMIIMNARVKLADLPKDEHRDFLDELLRKETYSRPRCYAVSFRIAEDSGSDSRRAKLFDRARAASYNGHFWCEGDCLIVLASTMIGTCLRQYLHDQVLNLGRDFIAVMGVADHEFYISGPYGSSDILCDALNRRRGEI